MPLKDINNAGKDCNVIRDYYTPHQILAMINRHGDDVVKPYRHKLLNSFKCKGCGGYHNEIVFVCFNQ